MKNHSQMARKATQFRIPGTTGSLKDKSRWSCLISMLVVLLATPVCAGEITLLTCTSDLNADAYRIVLEVDDEGGMLRFYQDTYRHGRHCKRKTFSLDELRRSYTLYKTRGKGVLKLSLDDTTKDNRTRLKITYLYNGLTGSYRCNEIALVRSSRTWSLEDNGNRVTQLQISSRKKPVVGTIGVKTLAFL